MDKKLLILPLLLIFFSGCSLFGNVAIGTQEDFVGRQGFNTVFGDTVVASRIPNFAAQFQYGLETNSFNSTIVGSGSFDFTDSMLNIHTGTDSNGSVILESTNYLRYIPGYEVQGLFTAIFSNDTNINQRAGIFDDENGFYLKWNGENFQGCRIRDSVESCDNLNTTDVFGEGIDLNISNGNIYSFSYGYLGFAPITFSVMTPQGSWVLLHQIEFPNSQPQTHITQSHLPLRAENSNEGSTTNSTLSFGSLWAGIVDGNIVPGTISDPTARFFTQQSEIKTASSGNVFAFRSKNTYNGVDNRIQSLLKLVSCTTDGNKPVAFRLLQNPNVTSANWTDVHENSVLQVSDNLVLAAGAEDGTTFMNWGLAKSDSFFEDVSGENLLLPPGGVAVFYFESTQSTETQCSIRWAELF